MLVSSETVVIATRLWENCWNTETKCMSTGHCQGALPHTLKCLLHFSQQYYQLSNVCKMFLHIWKTSFYNDSFPGQIPDPLALYQRLTYFSATGAENSRLFSQRVRTGYGTWNSILTFSTLPITTVICITSSKTCCDLDLNFILVNSNGPSLSRLKGCVETILNFRIHRKGQWNSL